MKDTTLVVAGMATLSAGTYAFRLSGQELRARISFPPRVTRLLEAAAVILLAALVATTGLTEGHGFSGFARPAEGWEHLLDEATPAMLAAAARATVDGRDGFADGTSDVRAGAWASTVMT